MLPRPVDPAVLAFPDEPLQRLALGVAWRQRALGHALGHGLRRVPGGSLQNALLLRIAHALGASDAFTAACGGLGVRDAELLVQGRLIQEPLPHPESLAEAATVDALYAAALDAGLSSLAASADQAIAAAVGRAGAPPAAYGRRVLEDLASDARNAPCLQLLVDRWMPATVMAFGRPGSDAERVLLQGRVKVRSSSEQAAAFLRELEPWLLAVGLEIREANRLGVALPDGFAPRRRKEARRGA